MFLQCLLLLYLTVVVQNVPVTRVLVNVGLHSQYVVALDLHAFSSGHPGAGVMGSVVVGPEGALVGYIGTIADGH